MSQKRLVAIAALTSLLVCAPVRAAENSPLATVVVQASGTGAADSISLDAVVEAVRQTTLSAQVPGAIVSLRVKAGDSVKAGQELLRIDARSASQNAAASDAQVQAAQASLNVATKDYERQKQLFQKQYISQSALDRAQAQWQATQAQVRALQAQAGAARTQSGFFVVNAPYAGVVSDVPVTLGDMAMPGRALVTMHDPAELRVTAAVPQSAIAGLGDTSAVRFELPGLATGLLRPTQVQVLPVVDAATHTAQVRLGLPAGIKGVAPGAFARIWLPLGTAKGAMAKSERLYVPASAVVRRSEMTGLYVVNPEGLALLRQVRLGGTKGDQVEVLSGVSPGDKVALDPQTAARVR
ncbi:efflux RND transporter periplasmic adaptor subunit [Polaromonas glacialis]|uniref:efflux RND transporter periplasmic adaptor subunit n=1 Tax=Polaromonas glacialis TaxID=866564 RepID=UPI0004951760|nr:efflux RND transporter periplasmic adaptor subunit [Polaromonas glacialis]